MKQYFWELRDSGGRYQVYSNYYMFLKELFISTRACAFLDSSYFYIFSSNHISWDKNYFFIIFCSVQKYSRIFHGTTQNIPYPYTNIWEYFQYVFTANRLTIWKRFSAKLIWFVVWIYTEIWRVQPWTRHMRKVQVWIWKNNKAK